MARTSRGNERLEQGMRFAARQKQNDDIERQVIIIDGEEFLYSERTRQIVWRADPQSGELVPYSMSVTSYPLADDGRSFGKSNFAACKCGCRVRADSVFSCRHCKGLLCRRHAIFVSSRAYCRKGFCAVIGRTGQVLWFLYRIIRFCIRSVGLCGDRQDERPKEEFPAPCPELPYTERDRYDV